MSDWRDSDVVDLDEVNGDVTAGSPTADVAIHIPSNLDPSHADKVTPALLLDGFDHAKRIFGDAGVQLRLSAMRTGTLRPSLFDFHSTTGSGTPGPRTVNTYRRAERSPSELSPQALEAFEAVVGDLDPEGRTVHLVVLQDVYLTFYEQLDHRSWQRRTISTGGLSFPNYMYGPNMPRHVRGALSITNLTKDDMGWKIVAHEIGHKLMNVSHEHRSIPPQHEVRAEGGLMVYGSGVEIASGPEGRYHRERLHRSPYVYTVEGDDRVYNQDYMNDGFYYDPIYEGVSVDLDEEASR